MAIPTQFACKFTHDLLPVMTFPDSAFLDRTLKGIGIVEAAPIYESLPEFEK